MSPPNRTKSVAMTTLFGKCGGCGAKVEALTRGDLSFCPQETTALVREPEGTAEVSRGRSRTAGRSEGPNGSKRGRPVGFAVVGTQQLQLWDRLPGSESPGATVCQAMAAAMGPDPAATIVMEEVVRKENLVKALKQFFAERELLTPLRIWALNGQVGPNRRIRTRMSGGVGGRRPRGRPLSRLE